MVEIFDIKMSRQGKLTVYRAVDGFNFSYDGGAIQSKAYPY
jgi:hypothetical protein